MSFVGRGINTVRTVGNQIIKGTKTFLNMPNIQNTNADKGETGTGRYWYVSMCDKNGTSSVNRLGMWQTSINIDGTVEDALYAYKNVAGNSNTYAALKICYPLSGSPYATCPKPSLAIGDTNYDAQIVNIKYLNDNITISGAKTFNDDVIFGSIVALKSATASIQINNSGVTKGTPPATTKYSSISFRDNTGNVTGTMARILTGYTTSKESQISLAAFQCDSTPADVSGLVYAGVTVRYPASGDPYATAPASDKTNAIVTTTAQSKGASGYFKLGNGLIIQWGKVALGTSTTKTITLPTAFTTTNYSVSAVATNKTATNFKVASSTSLSTDYDYIAIGY